MKNWTPSCDDFQTLTENLTSRTKNCLKLMKTNFCDQNQHTLAHAESNCETSTTTHLFFWAHNLPSVINQTQSINLLTSHSHQSGRYEPVLVVEDIRNQLQRIQEGTQRVDSLKSERISL